MGDPIHCWHPAELTKEDWFAEYAESYCWVANTYYVFFTEELFPVNTEERKDREITYYQWVPIILCFQAFLYKMPNVVWKLMHSNSGLNLNKLVKMADESQLYNPIERLEVIENMAAHIDKWLDVEQIYKWNRLAKARAYFPSACCVCCSKRNGTFLTGLFTIVKILFTVNNVCQIIMLNSFLAMNYPLYGIDVIIGMVSNKPWTQSPRFPLVTFCDFEIRQLQNVHRYTLQCVLPINLFNEKIFIFLWFWIAFVTCISIVNLFSWWRLVFMKRNLPKFVMKYLKVSGLVDTDKVLDKKACLQFAHKYLRDDGIFVLRIVSSNCNDLVTTDLVNALWRRFQHKQASKAVKDTKVNIND